MVNRVLPPLTDNPEDADRPWWLRTLRHCNDLIVAWLIFALGLTGFLLAPSPSNFTSGPFQEMPTPLTYIITCLLMTGGATAFVAISMRIKNVTAELVIEQVGWFLALIGWVGYFVGFIGYGVDLKTIHYVLAAFLVVSALNVTRLALHHHILAKRRKRQEKVTQLLNRIEGNR